MLIRQVSSLLQLTKPLQFVRQLATQSGDFDHKIEKCINEVSLLGRVGADAKKGGSEDKPVVYFSLATNMNYKLAATGEMTQKTDWHRVAVFKPILRDTVYNYLRKGQRVFVKGRLNYGEITDASGTVRPTTAIVADDVIFFQ